MKLLCLSIRFPLIVLHILLGVVLCVVALHRLCSKASSQRIICWWLHVVGKIFGLRVQVVGSNQKGPVCLVANHISWLDIVVLGSIQPVSFLSKEEIKHWPVVGYLAKKSGTLFIQRGFSGTEAKESVKQHFVQRNSVAIFPEGTTSDGITTRPFYPRLFAAVLGNHIPIQPVALIYPPLATDDPAKVNPVVPLKNNTSFFTSTLAIMQQRYTPVIVRYAPTILPTANQDRKTIAAQTYHAILEQINAAQSDRAAAINPLSTGTEH